MSAIFTVDRYLARGYLIAFVVVLITVVTLLQSLDLMNEADILLAAEGAGVQHVLRYVGWRAPQLADRFAPFVALLAGLLTFARLSQSSEIIAMRAAGVSPLRVIAPLCAVGGAIALVHFVLHEVVVVEANARLEQWRALDYAPDADPGAEPIVNIRVSDGETIVRADLLSMKDGAWTLENLRVYGLGEGGFSSTLRAREAAYDGTVWRLADERRLDTGTGEWVSSAQGVWADSLPPDQIVAAALDPEMASLVELRRAADATGGADRSSPRFETAFLHRFTAPFASLIMPLLAAIAGFGLHRANTLLARVAAGLGLGFAYFVFDNFMVVMGRLDAAPPLLAVFAAPLLFLGAGLAMRK